MILISFSVQNHKKDFLLERILQSQLYHKPKYDKLQWHYQEENIW